MESPELQQRKDALKAAVELLPLPEREPGGMYYVDTLPYKYARYYTWFAPEQRSYTAEQKKRLIGIQKDLKKLTEEFKKLPPEIRCDIAQNFNFRPGLGMYFCATELLDMAVTKTLDDAPELKKGRPKNPYKELVDELGRDFKFVTGREPSLSYDPYEEKPSGDFYHFVDAVFSALGIKEQGNIEHLIRTMDEDIKLPNGWD